MSDGRYASGARPLVLALLVAALGLAMWQLVDDSPRRPAAGGEAARGQAPGGGGGLGEVMAQTGAAIGPCLTKAAGPSAAPSKRDAGNERELVAILSNQIERLRGLKYGHPVDARFLGSKAIQHRIDRLLEREPQTRGLDGAGRALAALGAVAAGDDPRQIAEDALKGQVAGLYVPESEELLVLQNGRLGVSDTLTLVHELEHALADQALGIRENFSGKRGDAGEESLAYSAVAEGDATLTQEAYLLRHGGLQDQLDAISAVGPALKAQRQLETFPYYIQRRLLFPYLEGLRFDCARFERGGWSAVDKAYGDPPKTSAEVMFPERYGERIPRLPPAAKLGAPWKRKLTTTLGAADLEWLFSAPGDALDAALTDPRRRARAWAAGRLALWTDGPRTALSIDLLERTGEIPLCDSIAAWYRAAFPGESVSANEGASGALAARAPGRSAALNCTARLTRFALAPDRATATRLAKLSPRLADG